MRTLFIIPLVLMSLVLTVSPVHSMSFLCGSVGIGCETVTKEELVQKGSLYFKKFTNVPFTGNVEGEWQGAIKDGLKNGEWVIYYNSGSTHSKGNFKNGRKNGSWKGWYFDQKLKYEGNFEDGKGNGSWIGYFSNGRIRYQGDYKNNSEEGFWEWFNDDGTVDTELTGTYKNGEKVSD